MSTIDTQQDFGPCGEPKTTNPARQKLVVVVLLCCLGLFTFLAYGPLTNADFINYDDDTYITHNDHIAQGFTLDGLFWAFRTDYAGNWHPLTWISHMLDIELFGLNPQWHHFVNIVFHIANTLLLFLVLRRMTRSTYRSAFVAAMFAVHPLHVESVAWVAERKDLLCAFFWMLTLWAYCAYVERPGWKRYGLMLLSFALALMAKPMAVTLPFVLLLLDYWPLRRVRVQQELRDDFPEFPRAASVEPTALSALVIEKTPLFFLAAVSGVVTFAVQKTAGAVVPVEIIPLQNRLINAVVSYAAYLIKSIRPEGLAVFYPHPDSWPFWQIGGALLVLLLLTLLAFILSRRFPYATMGWLWFVGTLVPVIGLVQVGVQARADRYTYLPLIGLFIAAAWVVPELIKEWRYRKEMLIGISVVSLSVLFLLTWFQVGYWKNSITVFEHALNVTENNYVAHNNLGAAYYERGRIDRAIFDFNKAIEINPNYVEAYNNRGNVYAAIGNPERALSDYSKAIDLNPGNAVAFYNRANVLADTGRFRLAIEDYDRALAINPRYADAYFNRGVLYESIGDLHQAYEDMRTAALLGDKNARNFLQCRQRAS